MTNDEDYNQNISGIIKEICDRIMKIIPVLLTTKAEYNSLRISGMMMKIILYDKE